MTDEKKTGASLARGKSKQNYATPLDFMAAIERRFGVPTYDLAASRENTKASLFFEEEADSLKQEWHVLSGLLWLNPPFDNITPWAVKCASESALGATPILLLTPASVDSNWFKQWVQPGAHVIALNGRLCFDGKNPYPKGCMLSVFWAGITGFSTWSWQK